jgi:hypothetical protein
LLLAHLAWAQTESGAIYGKIVDAEKNPLPGVTVTLSGPRMAPMTAATDETGIYKFPQIPPGNKYVIKAELQGFKSIEKPHVVVAIGKSTEVNLTLKVGKIHEPVTVDAAEGIADPTRTHTHIPIFYVGQWDYEGAYSPGFTWAAGQATGKATGESMLHGYFLEWQWTEQGPAGETQGFEVLCYDPVNETYSSHAYGDDGSSTSGAYTFDGNVSHFSGKLALGGKQYSLRGKQYFLRVTEVFSADWMNFTQKAEISTDGQKWMLMFEGKFTKVGSAPKKLP